MKNKNRRKSGESGAILVEAAFALPILALILLCIIDLGLAIREHQILQNGAREGARVASIPPETSLANVRSTVTNYCRGENIAVNPADVTVTPALIPLGDGLYAHGTQVTVAYTKQMLILGAPILPSNTITLRGVAVFRNLF